MTHEIDGDVIARIVRAFNAAFMRFAKAETFDEQEDETSNLLHQLYRLAQARHGEQWKGLTTARSDLKLVPPLVWLRHTDVHSFVTIVEPADKHIDTYTNLYGVLTWRVPRPHDDTRWDTYNAPDLLDGEPVIDTLKKAKNALLQR